jgi:hypothetical protein
MTQLTRRDALLLTTAAAAVSSTVPSAMAQAQQPTDDASLFEVPNGTVNGSSIPITVRIPPTKLTQGTALKQVTVELSLQNPTDKKTSTIFTATLTDKALPPSNISSDIVLMTRLKIAADPWKAPAPAPQAGTPPTQAVPSFQATLLANIAVDYANASKSAFTATKGLMVQPEDCPPSKVSLLRLAIAPLTVSSGKALLVKAVAPPVAAVDAGKPARPLKGIDCQLQMPAAAPPTAAPPAGGQPAAPGAAPAQPPAPLSPFTMTTNGLYLTDEAFVSFNIYPTEDTILAMHWKYDPALVVTAQAYVSTKT